LFSLGDIVRDIWMDPRYRNHEMGIENGWDIVLDRSRGITPDNPKILTTVEQFECYPVQKA
jgi:hypothetical protein